MTFVARHALWSDEQRDAASRMRRLAEEKNLEVIRLAFPDQHGILRGKTIIAAEALASLEDGTVVAVQQGSLLGTSFHPEVTGESRFHGHFLSLVAAAR